MLAATLGVSLLGNMLAGKGIIRGGDGVILVSKGTNWAGQEFQCRLIL